MRFYITSHHITTHHIASYRIASHRIASHRIASRRLTFSTLLHLSPCSNRFASHILRPSLASCRLVFLSFTSLLLAHIKLCHFSFPRFAFVKISLHCLAFHCLVPILLSSSFRSEISQFANMSPRTATPCPPLYLLLRLISSNPTHGSPLLSTTIYSSPPSTTLYLP
jgi:hypothetical protein